MGYAKLPSFEIYLYFSVWISTICFAIYRVYESSELYFGEDFEDRYGDLSEGWTWLKRRKDVSDNEWKVCTRMLASLAPWWFVHHTVAECLRRNRTCLETWHIAFGSVIIVHHLGGWALAALCLQPVLFCMALRCRLSDGSHQRLITWTCGVLALFALHMYNHWESNVVMEEEEEEEYRQWHHICIMVLAWTNLRCLNYFLDAETRPGEHKTSVVSVLAYCLYLPLLFHGPLVLYSDYEETLRSNGRPPMATRLVTLCARLLRFGWWLGLTELILHFVYVNALAYRVDVLWALDAWALYGFGYCMGQFFHLKYVVLYGFACTLAQWDGARVPDTPKCIGRIHLYSDMWRHFDAGLYAFLFRYIYGPVAGKCGDLARRLLGSSLCFLFVYVWHGMHAHVAVWSLLNFVGVTLEKTACLLNEAVKIRCRGSGIIVSAAAKRRLTCAAASPLFAMSALSNFYFFAGKQVGDLFVARFCGGIVAAPSTPLATFLVLCLLYCGSNVSVQIKHWEKTRANQQSINRLK